MRGRGLLIPEAILRRIEEFATLRKTGTITLNVYQGVVGSADLREHIRTADEKMLDKSGNSCSVHP